MMTSAEASFPHENRGDHDLSLIERTGISMPDHAQLLLKPLPGHHLSRIMKANDPEIFHNSLADEFAALIENFGITRDDVRQLILHGICAAWLSDERKRDVKNEFENHPAWDDDGQMRLLPSGIRRTLADDSTWMMPP